ncbi:WSC domain-containing protein [Apodospora peruviana]|uniref:WSC domain-containing protein n=1 Tax=Apodospora peruviana TaxID=516989 RepID=A0AAE0I5B6_9PEZI|nr:WSC domain-containing protein [Apodospora peruviana]
MASTRSSTTSLRAAALLILFLSSSIQAASVPAHNLKRDDPSFASQGCFAGTTNGQRTLNAKSYESDDMTIESCAAYCSKYKYFGVEYGHECYCGDTNPGALVASSECSFPCPGNAAETCGAGGRLSLYLNEDYATPAPATLSVPYLGCFIDTGARVLPDNLLGADDMTAAKCAAHCADYSYFGVEYGRECWCGNSPPKNAAPESECSMTCAGNDMEICGAGGRINVWGSPLPSPDTVGDFEYQGCFTDHGNAHSLTGKVVYDSAMTLEKCAASCAGYTFFGVEYASQCYCGNTLATTAEEKPQAECSMRCGGAYDQVCGDADRLNVFEIPAGTGGPSAGNPSDVCGFDYKGCWTDDLDARSLTGDVWRSDEVTVEACAEFCDGYTYFGTEYGTQCYCGNELAGAAAPESECSELCGGDSSEWCGAPNRLSFVEQTRYLFCLVMGESVQCLRDIEVTLIKDG